MSYDPDLKELVRQTYAAQARRAASESEEAGNLAGSSHSPCCCGAAGCGDPVTKDLYPDDQTAVLPQGAVRASLGCGNPTALADLRPGDVVLDLGSGGGADVLLSARRVGPTGKAYGLDMTDEMLDLARANARKAGLDNVEFVKGEIERIPLPDASVDVIISNCVINLSADKRQVVREAYRVLRPGGRFAVSDVVVQGPLPAAVRRNLELWAGCVAGALEVAEFEKLLAAAGFEEISIEPTRIYRADDARIVLAQAALEVESLVPDLDGRLMAAFVRARKPAHPLPRP
jgi:SAM-dependent methyltransferase